MPDDTKLTKSKLTKLRDLADKSARQEAIWQLREAAKYIRSKDDDAALGYIHEALQCMGSIRGVWNLWSDTEEEA